ncbi:hypothetical protein ACRRTK_017411 [Alexandromys fortis]
MLTDPILFRLSTDNLSYHEFKGTTARSVFHYLLASSGTYIPSAFSVNVLSELSTRQSLILSTC